MFENETLHSHRLHPTSKIDMSPFYNFGSIMSELLCDDVGILKSVFGIKLLQNGQLILDNGETMEVYDQVYFFMN